MHYFKKISPKRYAILLWIIYILVVAAFKFNTAPSPGNVYNIYLQAGIDWLNKASIYDSGRFLYYPFTAIFFTPFKYLPFNIGGAIWRSINIIIFALGVFHITKNEKQFLTTSIVALILSWAAARHGQATLAMAGFMLVACSLIERKNFARASVFLALATLVKPLSIVLVLLALALYPKTIPYTLSYIILFIAICFFLTDSSYLLEQLKEFPEVLKSAVDRSDENKFLHIFSLLNLFNLSFNSTGQTITRAILALVTLYLSYNLTKKLSKNSAIIIYTLSSSYILLLGAGTEKNTYALFAPVIGFYCYNYLNEKKLKSFALVLITIVAWLSSYSLYKSNNIELLFFIKPTTTIIVTFLIIFNYLKHCKIQE